MGLSNLKRKDVKAPKAGSFSVDAFIEDADAYAAGFPKVVSSQSRSLPDRRVSDRVADMEAPDPVGSTFKHATFTLTLETIEHLSIIASRDQFNKSKLIRILIENQINLSKSERVKVYQQATTV